jgi:ferritin
MLSAAIVKLLNSQITAEFYSAQFYFALAGDFAKMGLMGFSHWLVQQWREEHEHALKIAEYVVNRGGELVLEEIQRPEPKWECPCEAMKEALKHEKLITERINSILRLARDESDYATESFLRWFVDEQVEEEATLYALVGKLEMVGDDQAGIVHCDHIMGDRPKFCCTEHDH